MHINDRVSARARQIALGWALPALLVLGALARLFFIRNEGFTNDIATYVAWALGLSRHGFATFYSTIGFVDYPPGYFYILAMVGHLWRLFFAAHDPSQTILHELVKVPAVLADLGVGALIHAVVRRFTGPGVALGAAALYLLNPAIICDSAVWGQADSIAGGFALLAIYALIRSGDHAQGVAHTGWIVGGWLAFAYSLLIKPQAAVLFPLLVAFAFVDSRQRRARVAASAIGAVAAVSLAVILVEPFHPSTPIAALSWLGAVYSDGANVYPYNSVNIIASTPSTCGRCEVRSLPSTVRRS